MQHVLLSRSPHRPEQGQPFLGQLSLARARVHEAHGSARHMLALLIAREMMGAIFWVTPNWDSTALHAPALARLGVDPGRITFVAGGHATDLLWSLEEVLRSGAVPLVVGELPAPPGLTAMRRMQLAAEAGGAAGIAPLGLILTPEGGAAGAESRWQMAPEHRAGGRAWRLARDRARTDPPRNWQVLPRGDGYALAPGRGAAD